MEIPDEDIKTAAENGLCFVIRTKFKRGARWEFVMEIKSDLLKTQKKALEGKCFETGILIKTKTGERIYWTSKVPNLFNSAVLSHVDVIQDPPR